MENEFDEAQELDELCEHLNSQRRIINIAQYSANRISRNILYCILHKDFFEVYPEILKVQYFVLEEMSLKTTFLLESGIIAHDSEDYTNYYNAFETSMNKVYDTIVTEWDMAEENIDYDEIDEMIFAHYKLITIGYNKNGFLNILESKKV